jgi:hypothetical protein
VQVEIKFNFQNLFSVSEKYLFLLKHFKLIIHNAIQMLEPSVWSYPVSLHMYTISSVLGQFSRVSSSQIQLFEYSLFENILGGKNDGRAD